MTETEAKSAKSASFVAEESQREACKDADLTLQKKPETLDEEDEEDEEDDDDYVLDSNNNEKPNEVVSDDGEDDYIDDEDRKSIAQYSSIESSNGGLIKTRKQRQLEEEENIKNKKQSNIKQSSTNVDINSIWAELNSTSKTASSASATPSPQPLASPNTPSNNIDNISLTGKSDFNISDKNKKIKITRTYEFAGKMISEEKWVDADSQEAKAHSNSTAIKNDADKTSVLASNLSSTSKSHSNPNLRKKRKRGSLLDAVISNSSKTKLSTLEKSRLDWATYVDKNKINDELKYKNKAGFLEKQDFLSRVDSRRDNLLKEAKSKK